MTTAIQVLTLNSISKKSGSFTDIRDGKTYKIIKIGNQTQMAENIVIKDANDFYVYNNDQTNSGFLF